jgi:hypothetical protein
VGRLKMEAGTGRPMTCTRGVMAATCARGVLRRNWVVTPGRGQSTTAWDSWQEHGRLGELRRPARGGSRESSDGQIENRGLDREEIRLPSLIPC